MADSEVRQKFEAWVAAMEPSYAPENLEKRSNGSYRVYNVFCWWHAWKVAFEAGMRAGEIARWIPVEEKDKLPPEGTKVLAWFREYAGSHSPYIHRFAEICEGHWRPEGGSGNFDDRVTHWQPLPAAPEENTHDK